MVSSNSSSFSRRSLRVSTSCWRVRLHCSSAQSSLPVINMLVDAVFAFVCVVVLVGVAAPEENDDNNGCDIDIDIDIDSSTTNHTKPLSTTLFFSSHDAHFYDA
eukprot:m.137076 g.137076  ORF g.137076 m.137076 type:complete len:104 (-) comp29903_c2_seq1:28-339(-)